MSDQFPFNLSDVVGWIIKKKDGVIIKYNLISAEELARETTSKATVHKPGGWGLVKYGTSYGRGYSAWCNHEPHPNKGDEAVFASEGIAIWIGDNPGAYKSHKEFDVCIDGGNVLSVAGEHDLPILYGDPKLRNNLQRFLLSKKADPINEDDAPRILKIRWTDRAKPPVSPKFWPALLDQLRKIRDDKGFDEKNPLRVMTICQGGHGRSGSAAASLIMCMSDYTPLDALTHIRAIHCARAIESKEQHEYLNDVAEMLGRKQDALEAGAVPSFKNRLLKMTSEWAQPYKARIEAGTGAKNDLREGSYL